MYIQPNIGDTLKFSTSDKVFFYYLYIGEHRILNLHSGEIVVLSIQPTFHNSVWSIL
jgi:hypothetical protein